MFKNTKKRKAAVLFLGLAALMVPSTTLMAQYDGNGGLFGLGNKAESGVQRDGGLLGSSKGTGTGFNISTEQFGGENGGGEGGFSIGTEQFGAPLGSGLFIMAAAGAAYAFSKKRKQQENK